MVDVNAVYPSFEAAAEVDTSYPLTGEAEFPGFGAWGLSKLGPVNPVHQVHPVIPVEADWKDAVRISYVFKTDIITSGNGKEQRRAVRFNPRKELGFNFIAPKERKTNLDMFMAKHQNSLVIAPEYPKVLVISQEMNTEDFFAYTSGDGWWVKPGMLVVLMAKDRVETRYVSGNSDFSISFSDNSKTIFPIGTRIYPALIGYLQTDPNVPRPVNSVSTGQFTFFCDPGTVDNEQGEPEVVIDGLEVFMRKPNWAQQVQVSHSQPRETVDYDFGKTAQYTPIEFPSRVIQSAFWSINSEDLTKYIEFFGRNRGRAGHFFLPTWEDDVPYYLMPGNSYSILVRGTAFAEAYKDSTVFKRIMIRKTDGTFIHRKVDYIEALYDTDTSVVWLTELLPAELLNPSTVIGVSWVLAARFGTDRLDIDYRTNTVAEFTYTFQTLENFQL